MSRALWLPAALKEFGLQVVEVNGWQTRGDGFFNPAGVVCHHTASSATAGDHPSLSIVVNGRPDLAGPLCNVLLSRNGTCYVVSSGRANHAGTGGWHGLSGNSSVLGIEAESNGIGEPWPPGQIDAYHRLCAAMCKGGGFGPEMVCYHREWATPRGRKVDPAGPGIPQDGDQWRAAVAAAIDHPSSTEGFGTMTDAEIDAKFLRLAVDQAKLAEQLEKLAETEKRHNTAQRKRDAEILAAIEALAGS